MSEMSEFELIANDIETGVRSACRLIEEFGYNHDKRYAVSCIRANVVNWMTSFEERRLSGSFPTVVINELPENDEPNSSEYLKPAPVATVKQRMEAMWGVRIAYTHSAGFISGIEDAKNKKRAMSAPLYIPGCKIDEDFLDCSGISLHVCIRSIVHVQELLPIDQ